MTQSAIGGLSVTFAIIFLGQVFVAPGPPSRASKLLDYPLMPGVAFLNAIKYGRPHDPDFWVFAMAADCLLYSAVFLVALLVLKWRKLH